MTEVAVFDLDRTLLAGGSGPVITRALAEEGLVPAWQATMADRGFGVYDRLGESRLTMELTRRMVARSRGWDRSAVDKAAGHAADVLERRLLPRARALLDEHKQAGRPVVLATTTAVPLVQPLADRLGVDDVVATRWECDDDGCYTGRLDGPFVWGPAKKEAVAEWCARNGADLSESWAYSDSVYDLPLLEAAGHPHAVNPDARLRAIAMARRWPVLDLTVAEGVPSVAGVELLDLALPFLDPRLFTFARWKMSGLDHIPRDGGVILAANHRSYLDPVAVTLTAARRGRKLRFLGKAEVFDAPVVGQMARLAGGIRVDRGTGSDQPLDEAERALAQGEAIMIFPQGTIPRGEAFFDPVLKGRWGAARLAARTGVPVIPIGLWGTEKVWPRRSRVPRLLTLRPPRITITVGPPVDLRLEDPSADTERIMEAIVDLLPAEARQRREPTAREIELAKPPA